jgi:uncharacterized protein (DUF3820 family)
MANSSRPHSPAQAPAMPFGRHKSTPLQDLPSEYLLWLGCLDTLRQPLLGHVLKEMARRIVEFENQPKRVGLAAHHEDQYASR